MLEDIVLNVVDLMINSLEAKLEERIMNTLTVSYTHLTLPTT